MPPVVVAFIQSAHEGYEIKKAEKLEKEGQVYYQLVLEGKLKKDLELVVNSDGTTANGIAYWD